MRRETHEFDFCVVGGGMAGLIAAVAAARRGATVALIQDRPVLGGNASGEVRMHICGARGDSTRETGILEELLLENYYRNAQPNYTIWDSVTYGLAKYQEGLTLFLNCTVNECSQYCNSTAGPFTLIAFQNGDTMAMLWRASSTSPSVGNLGSAA